MVGVFCQHFYQTTWAVDEVNDTGGAAGDHTMCRFIVACVGILIKTRISVWRHTGCGFHICRFLLGEWGYRRMDKAWRYQLWSQRLVDHLKTNYGVSLKMCFNLGSVSMICHVYEWFCKFEKPNGEYFVQHRGASLKTPMSFLIEDTIWDMLVKRSLSLSIHSLLSALLRNLLLRSIACLVNESSLLQIPQKLWKIQ